MEEFAAAGEDAAEELDRTDSEFNRLSGAAEDIAKMQGRAIVPREYGGVMLSCLEDAGFDGARVTPDGEGIEAVFESSEQRAGYNLVLAACESRFPSDKKFTEPLNDTQLRMLYDHFTGSFSRCVRAQGYDVTEPPSVQKFIETYESGSAWDPLNDTLASLTSSADVKQLESACAHLPADLY